MPSRSRGSAPPASRLGRLLEDRRPAVPTRRLLLFLVPLAGLSLLPIWWAPLGSLWWAALLLLVFLAVLDFRGRPGRGAVGVRRELGEEYRVGRRGRYTVVFENRGATRVDLRWREVLPPSFEPRALERELSLAGGEREQVTVEFLPHERGGFVLEDPALRLASVLGLVSHQERCRLDDEISILPGRPRSETAVLLSRAALLKDSGRQLLRRLGHDSDFESLRDYVVGDDLRFVDWKASARRMRPQVRQFQIERNTEILLALDCGRTMGNLVRGVTKLDLAMVPVLDLAAVAVQAGERVGLLAFDAEVLAFVPPRGGLRQLGHITETLAGLDTGFLQTSYTAAVEHLEAHHKKRALLVVFTDFTDEISSRDLQVVLAALGRRHTILFVAVGDEHLDDILAEEPRQVGAVYQKAVAGELLAERQRVLEGLTRHGVLTIDAEPRRMTAPLIQRYLQALERR